MLDDLKTAVRSLRASPAFTSVALLVLTLGVGAGTAIFSVVDAVVLRGLPFDEHDRLVAVGERRPAKSPDPGRDPLQLLSVAPQNWLDWTARQQVFESFAAIATGAITLQETGAEPEDLRGQRVTAAFFDVLRVRPAIGRAFTVENEVDGRDRVAVLSDAFWRRRFGGDPSVLGRTIRLDGQPCEVIGIMPPGMTYPVGLARGTDLWRPYVVAADERVRAGASFSLYLQTIGRLKPGVTIDQAQAQMAQIGAALEQANPVWNKNTAVGVRPLRDHLVGAQTRSWMLMLLGAVGLVLLIACANVASLLLARASARGREIAVRAALGASRWRLVRQLMIESLVLSIAGALLSIVVAWWAVHLLKTAMPEGVPRVAAIAVNLRVLAAAAGAAIATGLLFGIVPALQTSRPDLTKALKDDARGSVGAGRQHLRGALIVGEVALAVVLLVGSALFIGSFVSVMRIDPGFDPDHVLIAQLLPKGEPGKDSRAELEQIVERIGQIPGAVHASIILGGTPLTANMSTTSVGIPGSAAKETVSIRRVTPAYHQALRIPLRRGRLFDSNDRTGGANVVIVNESAAKALFPGEDAVGHAVRIYDEARTIVGVVGDVHQTSLEIGPRSEVYIPLAQGRLGSGELVIRTSGDPLAIVPAVKAVVLAVMPDVPLRDVRTMEETLGRLVAQRRLNMLLLGLFGVLGLVISAAGIYGVLAYTVSQRTREIGVRMALGATRAAVVGMVMKNASGLVATGLLLGGSVAWYLSAAAKRFLFGLDAADPRAFAAAMALLALAAMVASAVPARRASRVDPMVALRAE